MTNPLAPHIAKIKARFAPDKRVAHFQVTVVENGSSFLLQGESNLPAAVAALRDTLRQQGIAFEDRIQLLPATDLLGKEYGLVNLSVANLRSRPAHSAELATQALMGTLLRVYKKEGEWYFVQTPDGYLAWVDEGGIVTLDLAEMERWSKVDRLVYTAPYGHAYTAADPISAVVSDVVAGNVLLLLEERNGYLGVQYPDGRTAYVDASKAQPYGQWLAEMKWDRENLVVSAKTFMGLPYLWGGTSTKGVDCSGFTKMAYFLNGMLLPRDASQQVHVGRTVDSEKDFSHLEKGDLLFFGRKATDSTAEKVVHVGLWIGNMEMIHSSGRVYISGMDKKAENFDAFNYDRYLRTKRVLGEVDNHLRIDNH